MILRTPKTNPLFMALGILVALLATWMIVRLVFTFGWFASGLAAEKVDEERRREAPIDIRFQATPAAAPDATDANAPAADPNS